MQAVCRRDRPISPAHTWFDRHLPELTRRCRSSFRSLPATQREEAVAETLAGIFLYTLRAGTRGKLRLLTPYTLVWFFGRSYLNGRRMAGYRSTDVLSEAGRRRHHREVFSLHQPLRIEVDHQPIVAPLSAVLADSREDSPLENARRNLDYPAILEKEHVGVKGRRVFEYLCRTHGSGSQTELARELGVTPSRITQIKRRLAAGLARHGYSPPPTRVRAVSVPRANHGPAPSCRRGSTDHKSLRQWPDWRVLQGIS